MHPRDSLSLTQHLAGASGGREWGWGEAGMVRGDRVLCLERISKTIIKLKVGLLSVITLQGPV